jgi:hypothetical protein
MTIKINASHYQLNEEGGFSRFYKDLDHWCDAIICEPLYGCASVLDCLEPNDEDLKSICEELQETGKIRTNCKDIGEPIYILAHKWFFEDERETIGYYTEIGSKCQSSPKFNRNLETFRITHFANPTTGRDEHLAFVGLINGMIRFDGEHQIKRLIIDCDEALGETIFDGLLEMEAEVMDESHPENIQSLVMAISQDDQKLLKQELAKKRNLNQFNGYGNNSLFEAVHVGNIALTELLIKHGADVNAQNSRGFSAVHYAAKLGNLECVKKLVEMGADLNLKSVRNENCLMFAAALGNRELVQFLLKQGMNPGLKSKAGKTASKVAADFGHKALADELEKAG